METKPKSSVPGPTLTSTDVQTRPLGSGIDPKRVAEPRADQDSEKEFDPLRFGVHELPAGMRQSLIATKLPLVPADQLFDTHPPNKPLAATGLKNAPITPDSLPAVNAPDAGTIPLRSRTSLVVAVVAIVALLLGAVLLARPPSPPKLSEPAAPADTLATSSGPEPSLPTAVPAETAPTQNSAPSAASSLPDTKAPQPVRDHDSKGSESETRSTTRRHSSAPRAPALPSPQVTPKANGLDSAEFPKPD